MNKYRVEYIFGNEDDGTATSQVYVDALTREAAITVAFDELSDTGMVNAYFMFGSVDISDDKGVWVPTVVRKATVT